MMAEADDTAARVCKTLQDEQEKRVKYLKQGTVEKYALKDTVWVKQHHKDVLSKHRQASWYVPGMIARKVGQDVYAVQVGDNKVVDRNLTQLRPRAPDPSRRPVTFEFTTGDSDSDDEGEDDDLTAERILTDKLDPGRPGGGAVQGLLEGICGVQRFVGAPEQFCSEVHHGLDGVSKEERYFLGCQGRVGPFCGCSSPLMGPLGIYVCFAMSGRQTEGVHSEICGL